MRYIEDFIGAVKVRQAEIASSLVGGNATNYETYQRLVGLHSGLEESMSILNNLLKEDEKREL